MADKPTVWWHPNQNHWSVVYYDQKGVRREKIFQNDINYLRLKETINSFLASIQNKSVA